MPIIRQLTYFSYFILIVFSEIVSAKIFHERVIWTSNPAREAVIAWSSDDASQESNLIFLEKKGTFQQSKKTYPIIASQRISLEESEKSPVWFHHARLKNLTPNTTYFFKIQSSREATEVFSFVTAPESAGFGLIFGGDSRSDPEMRRKINRQIQQSIEANPAILALVFGGDFVYDGLDYREWDEWLEDYQLTRVGNRLLPIVPIRGNHEAEGELFNKIWDTPGGPENYFTTSIGPLAIINLNTNISHFGAQRTWLKEQLASLTISHRWIVANYHRPAYPAVKSPGEALHAWVPLFEDAQLDLVFESDGHAFKQTAPIFRNSIDYQRGIIYVGEGGMGVPMREPKDRWYFSGNGMTSNRYHYQILFVSDHSLAYQAVDDHGESFRSLTLLPRHRKLLKKPG